MSVLYNSDGINIVDALQFDKNNILTPNNKTYVATPQQLLFAIEKEKIIYNSDGFIHALLPVKIASHTTSTTNQVASPCHR